MNVITAVLTLMLMASSSTPSMSIDIHDNHDKYFTPPPPPPPPRPPLPSRARWMTFASSASTFGASPLNRLLLPGAHDAFSFDLGPAISPELPPVWVDILEFLEDLPLSRLYPFINKWARTQGLSPRELLDIGVRYFDVRTCYDEE